MREPLTSIRNAKGNDYLLPLYAAVLCETRKAMDDWVPVDKLPQYKGCIEGLGLTALEDCIFQEVKEPVVAIQDSPTTKARGVNIDRRLEPGLAGTVHVFISHRREWAEAALHAGWYPVVIPGERLMPKAKADARRLGHAFGYPECCTRAFLELNEWSTRSHLSEIFKRSTALKAGANCLTMRTALMAICHMPCHFDCEATISLTNAVLSSVRQFDPEYARQIEESLHGTFLVVNEAAVYRLVNARPSAAGFAACDAIENVLHTQMVLNEHTRQLTRLLTGATQIGIEDGMIVVFSNDEQRWIEPSIHAQWFEDPFIGTFS